MKTTMLIEHRWRKPRQTYTLALGFLQLSTLKSFGLRRRWLATKSKLSTLKGWAESIGEQTSAWRMDRKLNTRERDLHDSSFARLVSQMRRKVHTYGSVCAVRAFASPNICDLSLLAMLRLNVRVRIVLMPWRWIELILISGCVSTEIRGPGSRISMSFSIRSLVYLLVGSGNSFRVYLIMMVHAAGVCTFRCFGEFWIVWDPTYQGVRLRV